jgi:hypothetical protein
MYERAFEIIYNTIDPWTMEDPLSSKDQIFAALLQDVKDGIAFPFEKNDMVFYVMPETKYRARLHLFSQTKDAGTTVTSARELTSYMFNNINSLQKIYGITPHQKMILVAKRVGWKHEGTLKGSYYSNTGEMQDQYVFGVTRKEFT